MKRRRQELAAEMAYIAKCEDADLVRRAAAKIIHEFGGLNAFCQLLKEAHDEAARLNRPFTAVRILFGVIRLVQAAEELDKQAKAMVPDLSADELERAARELFSDVA